MHSSPLSRSSSICFRPCLRHRLAPFRKTCVVVNGHALPQFNPSALLNCMKTPPCPMKAHIFTFKDIMHCSPSIALSESHQPIYGLVTVTLWCWMTIPISQYMKCFPSHTNVVGISKFESNHKLTCRPISALVTIMSWCWMITSVLNLPSESLSTSQLVSLQVRFHNWQHQVSIACQRNCFYLYPMESWNSRLSLMWYTINSEQTTTSWESQQYCLFVAWVLCFESVDESCTDQVL